MVVSTEKVLSPGISHVKYQSSGTHCSKDISKVKVSERRTEWQNDGMTEWTKTLCPPTFDGNKKKTNETRDPWATSLTRGRDEICQVVLEKVFKYFKYNFTILLLSPLGEGCGPSLNKLESPPPKDALCQVWMKLAQWFWRRWKCGRQQQ